MKKNKQGGEVIGCAHTDCRVFESYTEYGELAQCLKCGETMTKNHWITQRVINRVKNWNWDWIDVGMMYLALYVALLLFWWFTL